MKDLKVIPFDILQPVRLAVSHWRLALKNGSSRISVEISDEQLLAFSF